MPNQQYTCKGCGPGKRKSQMRKHSSGTLTAWCNDCTTAKILAGRVDANLKYGHHVRKKGKKVDLDAVNEALQLGQETGAVLMGHVTKIVDFFAAQDEVITCLHFKYHLNGGGQETEVCSVEAETSKHRSYSI